MLALEEVLNARPGAIPLAVGSGTINDLTKLAAHRTNRRYLAVATAASMDGYTAFGASLTYQGDKQTFPCPAPLAVVADLDVIGAAPPELSAAGYADLAAKLTAGADWLLADALGVEPLHPAAWAMAQGGLREALAAPARVRQGEPGAIRRLTEGLMLSGFAMQAANSSRPASGAEHQFSHLWDMQRHTHDGKTPLHGFKVSIGSLAATALYEFVLSQPLDERKVDPWCPWWPSDAERENMVRRLFDPGELAEVASRESRAKAAARSVVRTQLESLRRRWPGLCRKLHQQLVPLAELKRMLQAAGAPAEPEQIGISRGRLREAFRQAYFIRRRFTILDLAFRADLLENALEHIFGSGGAWPLSTAPGARPSA
jgi:glycerol-1-phosphate dehydrogenase [NAD(P)+]